MKCFVLLVLFLFQSLAPAQAQSSDRNSSAGVYPLLGTDPDLPSTDLEFMDPLIGHAKLVALGESAHGVAGYKKLQFRVARYLIEQKGFRLLVVEVGIMRMRPLTQWLATCSNGVNPPVDVLQEPTEEDRSFLVWLCQFNQLHPQNTVRIRGMDIWDRPWEWQAEMLRINSKWKLGFEEELKVAHEHCWIHKETSWANFAEYMKILKREKRIPAADYDPCMQALHTMSLKAQKHLQARVESSQLLDDLFSFLQIVASAHGYQNNYHFAYQDFSKRWNAREYAQASNMALTWSQEKYPKAILIAHNLHTAKADGQSDWFGVGPGKVRSHFHYLKSWYGKSLVTLGLSGYDLAGGRATYIKPTSPDSIDLALFNQGLHTAFVDFNGSFATSKPRWFVHLENDQDNPNGAMITLKEEFDGLFFIAESPAGKPVLPWRNPWQW